MKSITGIKEIMIGSKDMSLIEFLGLSGEKIKDIIDVALLEESNLLYILDAPVFTIDNLMVETIYINQDITHEIPEGFIRLVFWSELQNTNASMEVNTGNIPTKLTFHGNNYGCLDDWGYSAFSMITTEKDDEVFLESESFGSETKTVYFLDSNKSCEHSIRDLDNNPDFNQEMIDIQRVLSSPK